MIEGRAWPPGASAPSLPLEGFHAPRWTGSGWTEGKRSGEILTAVKVSKRGEMEAAFDVECHCDFSSAFAAAGVLAASPTDVRIAALKTRAQKLSDADKAMAVAQVETVGW